MTPSQRADEVANRLQELVNADELDPAQIRAARVDGEWAVVAGDELIITADSRHAMLNRTTPQNLARMWSDNLLAALPDDPGLFGAAEPRPEDRQRVNADREQVHNDVERFTSRSRTVAGRQEGEVLFGNRVILRIRESAGGLTAYERAQMVSNRLQHLANAGELDPAHLRTARVDGEWVVVVGDELIVTADSRHARLNRTTPQNLARMWSDNLIAALPDDPARYGAAPLPTDERDLRHVEMRGNRFVPEEITVPAGTTVIWINRDEAPHTVISGSELEPDGKWASDRLQTGRTFSHTFKEAGTYRYHCDIHRGMVGTVIVQ
jgi:plastocyanin